MDDFKAQVAQGKILVGVGAGTGITAKCSEKADVDMLIIYNSGTISEWQDVVLCQDFLSYGDANAIVQEMGQEVLTDRKEDSSSCRCMRYRPVPCNGYFLKTVKRAGI